MSQMKNSTQFTASKPRHAHKPTLLKISTAECQAISACFKLYDYECKGAISKSSVKKLIKSLGFNIPENKLSSTVTLPELLLLLDQHSPDPEPALECSLKTWSNLVGHKTVNLMDEGEITVVSAQDIADFMESIGRPPISLTEANCLLTSLLEYDDCSDTPQVPIEVFTKQLSLFARKSNALKDASKI